MLFVALYSPGPSCSIIARFILRNTGFSNRFSLHSHRLVGIERCLADGLHGSRGQRHTDGDTCENDKLTASSDSFSILRTPARQFVSNSRDPTNILEWRSGFTDMAEGYGAEQVIYAHGQSRSRNVSTEWSVDWFPVTIWFGTRRGYQNRP